MKKTPATPARIVATIVVLGVLVSGWLLLAPGALGGSTTYVVTDGVSMQPQFHSGDLALIRAAGSYRVGDIVAYHSHALNTIVLHRIIAHDGSRYVFKGDNNNFIDPEHPTRAQLVGKLWLHVGGGGRGFLWLGSPKTIAVLMGATVLLLFGGIGAGARNRRRRRGKDAPPAPRRLPRPEQAPAAGTGFAPSAATVEYGLAASAVALVLCLGLGLIAFAHRGPRLVKQSTTYEQSGRFDYSATAPVDDVYPEGRVFAGDTIFLKLVHDVDVRFAYRFHSAAPHGIAGTASLDAVLTASTGWKRTFVLQAPTTFDGDRAVVGGTLALGPMLRLIRRVEAQTAIPGMNYTLSLVPHVTASGTIGGGLAAASFAPKLDFSLDPLALTPTLSSAAPAAAVPGAAAADALAPSSSGSADVSVSRPGVVALPKLHARAAVVSRVAEIGALISLAALAFFGLLFRRGRRADEDTRIQARHGDWLVEVTRLETLTTAELVEVTAFETLVRLAERSDRMIRHAAHEGGHSYRIADEGIVYAYTTGEPLEIPPPPAPVVFAAPPPPPPFPDALRRLTAVPTAPEPEPEPAPEPAPVYAAAPQPQPAPVLAAAPEPEPAPALVVPADTPLPLMAPRGRPLLRSPDEQTRFLEDQAEARAASY